MTPHSSSSRQSCGHEYKEIYSSPSLTHTSMNDSFAKKTSQNASLLIQEHIPFNKLHSIQKESPVVYHAAHDEVEEYNFTYSQFMIAGGMAGFFEHTAMYPVDTVKTRMQASNSPHYNGTFNALRTIIKTERYGIYRGVSAVAIGAVPSHALYFCTYEYIQQHLKPIFEPGQRQRHIEKNKHDEDCHNDKLPPHMFATSIAGAMATLVHDGVATPLDVIKQRMQLYNSGYKNIGECMKDVYIKEGISAFFRSYPTTLLMNIPYTIVHFWTYEMMKHWIDNGKDSDMEHNHQKHMISGGVAGASAAAFSTPVDVIKTRLQTQGSNIKYRGIMDTSRIIYQAEGLPAFFKGTVPRMMYYAPSAAITWCVYEYTKRVLA